MRICNKCGKNEVRSSESYKCASCHNEYQKAYHKKHPESMRASAKRRTAQIRRLIKESKDLPCSDCGIRYPSYVMDFDHVRGVKIMGIANTPSQRYSIDKILQEIAKCDVVCANCHRIRTHERQQD